MAEPFSLGPMQRRLVVAGSTRLGSAPAADALLVEGTSVRAIGREDDLAGPDLIVDRHPGATIVPGLRDAHLHPVGYAASLLRPSLKQARDFAAIADIVAAAATDLAPGAAITGLRLDDESLAEGRLPDRHLLDAVASDRPVLLIRYCGHVAVANTAALEAAGIGPTTPDPPGGVIDRDETGVPTGVLRETAFEPVTAALRPLAPELTARDVHHGLTALASTGLASVGAMAATDSGLWGGASSELEVLLEAAATSPIRIGVFVIARSPESLERAAEAIDAVGGRIRFLGVKMFSDGSFGGHTAAMREPFSDRPGETGTDRLDPSWARRMADAALALGGRVAIHAIGDRANGNVLDLMERLIDDGADPERLRIEHVSVLAPHDVERFGRLGITASVQPAFIASEVDWLERRVGPERLRLTYPFRSLAAAGAPLAGGSDSPVEPPHPLLGMATARDRVGVVPEEGLSAQAALDLFTIGAGRAIGEDAELVPGAPATFTVVDVDPVAADPDRLRAAQVVATWVEGEPVSIPDGITAWQA
jgi:predicted amidohydrolase YtcJ